MDNMSILQDRDICSRKQVRASLYQAMLVLVRRVRVLLDAEQCSAHVSTIMLMQVGPIMGVATAMKTNSFAIVKVVERIEIVPYYNLNVTSR